MTELVAWLIPLAALVFGGAVYLAFLTRAREAGYGSNLQKMQIGQDGE